MKILKLEDDLAEATPGIGSPHRLAGEVYLAAQRARGVLSEAEAAAERIRADASMEREQVKAEAAATGYQEGMARAAATLTRAVVERDRLLVESERELVRLALAITRQILQREVAWETPVVELVSSALAELRRQRQVRIRVHPDDVLTLRAAQSRLNAELLHSPGIDLLEDPAITRGGAIIETEGGTIDARIETQLEALGAALEEAMPS